MIPHNTKIFLVIVHYGDPKPTNQLVQSLCAQPYNTARIIIIDHATTPYHAPRTNMRVIRPKKNKGYGAGINIGITEAKKCGAKPDDIIICMNNDVTVSSRTLHRVLAFSAKQKPHSAGQALIGTKGGVVNLLTGRATITKTLHSKTYFNIPYIHGAFFFAPLNVFESIGGMPERYFMYWEDVLFSVRARKKGIPLRVAKDIGVAHNDEEAAASRLSPNHIYCLVHNGALFLEKETTAQWRLYWWITNRLRLTYHVLLGKKIVHRALHDAIRQSMNHPLPHPPMSFPRKRESRNTTQKQNIGTVIVTHNNTDTIEVCIASVKRNYISNIIIVDNASRDETTVHTKPWRGRNDAGSSAEQANSSIHLIHNTKNMGFAHAANQGAAMLNTRYILFLNPDAAFQCARRVQRDNLNDAVSFMNTHNDVAVIGLGLCSADGKTEKESFGEHITPISIITRHFKKKHIPTKPKTVGWVSGGAMLVRNRVFKKENGFDPSFFMYWEDVDFCTRVRKKGKKVVFFPSVRVTHNRGASHASIEEKTKLYDKSADNYCNKHYPAMICLLQKSLRRIYRLYIPQAR